MYVLHFFIRYQIIQAQCAFRQSSKYALSLKSQQNKIKGRKNKQKLSTKCHKPLYLSLFNSVNIIISLKCSVFKVFVSMKCLHEEQVKKELNKSRGITCRVVSHFSKKVECKKNQNDFFFQGFCLHLRHQENYLIDHFIVQTKSVTVLPTLVFLTLFNKPFPLRLLPVLFSADSFLFSPKFKQMTVLPAVYSVILVPLYLFHNKNFLKTHSCRSWTNVLILCRETFLLSTKSNKRRIKGLNSGVGVTLQIILDAPPVTEQLTHIVKTKESKSICNFSNTIEDCLIKKFADCILYKHNIISYHLQQKLNANSHEIQAPKFVENLIFILNKHMCFS